jgi:DNA-binding beta-propeller fold protein YncE
MTRSNAHRSFLTIACASPLVLVLLSGCTTSVTAPRPDEISGRYVAVMCDSDMTWSAFSSGALGEKSSERDSLTVVSLPLAPPPDQNSPTWKTTVAQVPVSNSAMGPPVSIAVTRDGNRAFVCETRGPAPQGATRLDQLPIGTHLAAVDLSNPAAPQALQQVVVGNEPTGCDVHPDGKYVAVVTRNPGGQLVLVPTSGATPMGEPIRWPLLGLPENARPTCVQWHPSGRYLAVTLPESNQVAFYEFNPTAVKGLPGLVQWGEAVTVSKYPASGRFTPDGRFFVTNDLQWGPDVEGFMAGAPEGQLSVIQLSSVDSSVVPAKTQKDGSGAETVIEDEHVDTSRVVHSVVSTATVGVSPESMAISPDGKFVVTGNLKGSYLATGDARATAGGSLTLLSLDDGDLTSLGDFPINAMPEGLAFDSSGNHVVVSAFRSFDPGAMDGELAFFKLARGSKPRLIPADFHVGVGRGPHGVLIVR